MDQTPVSKAPARWTPGEDTGVWGFSAWCSHQSFHHQWCPTPGLWRGTLPGSSTAVVPQDTANPAGIKPRSREGEQCSQTGYRDCMESRLHMGGSYSAQSWIYTEYQ